MKIAFIGGSLLSEMPGFVNATKDSIQSEKIKTPFGEPSDNFMITEANGCEIVYINRHGSKHTLAPHQINYRANMFALKILDVTHVISATAVGGITDTMSPMQWVVPDQLIDYTYGRMQTYNDGNQQEVNHIDFSFPFEKVLRQILINSVEQENLKCISRATYGVTQGPRLETIAEISRMEKDGCDIVGMTAMPEAALAKELEMAYATLSLVVNWAAGKSDKNNVGSNQINNADEVESISMEEIKQRIIEGDITIQKIMENAVSLLTKNI